MAKPKSSGIGELSKSSEKINDSKNVVYAQKEPIKISPDDARKRIEQSFSVVDFDGDKIVFSDKILEHWKSKNKNESDVNGRLSHLPMAIETVKKPDKVFVTKHGASEEQTAYLQFYRKDKKDIIGNIVFVKDGKVFSYFQPKRKWIDSFKNKNIVLRKLK